LQVTKDTGDYRIYPNPTADIVSVRPTTNNEIRIYNSFGRLVFSGAANEVISTKDWEDGIYWVKLEEQSAIKTIGKLVVLH
jgi:hypothetical protein